MRVDPKILHDGDYGIKVRAVSELKLETGGARLTFTFPKNQSLGAVIESLIRLLLRTETGIDVLKIIMQNIQNDAKPKEVASEGQSN